MERNAAVKMAQEAIKAQNKRLIDAVLKRKVDVRKAERGDVPASELPMIAVTCATSWEGYAITQELVAARKFRVRALFRTEGTQAARRLERLRQATESTHPGLLTLRPNTDLVSVSSLTEAFRGCSGVVIYVTANTSRAGGIDSHGNDPVGGRAAVMRQVAALIPAIHANPTITLSVMVNYPTDKVRGLVPDAPEAPWFIQQRLRLPKLLRDQGITTTCIHRPAYYYAMHRVDYTAESDIRGSTALARTMIREDNMPGIMPPDFVVNWVDVRDVGKWCGTCFEYPEVFANQDFSIASAALTGIERAALAERINRHGTTFRFKRFPPWLMRILVLFKEEVSYPLKYTQWYGDHANAYDFASESDLEELDRIHPRWTFEKKLREWGIDELRPSRAGRAALRERETES